MLRLVEVSPLSHWQSCMLWANMSTQAVRKRFWCVREVCLQGLEKEEEKKRRKKEQRRSLQWKTNCSAMQRLDSTGSAASKRRAVLLLLPRASVQPWSGHDEDALGKNDAEALCKRTGHRRARVCNRCPVPFRCAPLSVCVTCSLPFAAHLWSAGGSAGV